MADIKSPEARSRNMAKIRSKDTQPEVWFRKKLFMRGYRYRKNSDQIEGHPDIFLSKYKTAIFINGCFWHRHSNCRYAYFPKSRVDFWAKKFEANIKRDAVVKEALCKDGIHVLVVWECTVKQMMRSEEAEETIINTIEAFIRSEADYLEL